MLELLVAPENELEERPGRLADDPGSTDPRRRSRATALPAAATLTTMGAVLARWGYRFGMDDQAVNALKGVARADPTAFVGDWFTANVPQPHWLFDLVTYGGERLGVLPLVYLFWWLASLSAFGLASAWLARRFLPDRPGLAVLLGPVLALGPATALGSGTALWGYALPQGLGACLAFLAVSALLTARWRVAAVTAVLAGLAHVQHGADLAPILFGVAALATARPLRHRMGLMATAVALVAQAALVGHVRGIENGGDGWLEACSLAIPFHCDANGWKPVVFVAGALVTFLALAFAFAHRRDWRTVAPAVALPAGALLAAALADRLDMPLFGQLVQRFNVYRLAGLVLPLAAFALLWIVNSLTRSGWTPRRAAGAILVVLAWFTIGDAAFHEAVSGGAILATALLLAGVAALLLPGGQYGLALGLLLAGGLAVSGVPPVHLGYDRSDPGVAAALAIARSTEPGALIAADPAIYWLRAISRRAVIAECKGIAFGGDAWAENTERIDMLGGWACTPGPSRFAALPPTAIEGLQSRFGATHVLLTGDDPKLAHARTHWPLVLDLPARRYPFMESGWSLFRIDTFAQR